jgi:hypothetical protein
VLAAEVVPLALAVEQADTTLELASFFLLALIRLLSALAAQAEPLTVLALMEMIQVLRLLAFLWLE